MIDNSITVFGRLVRNPELRFANNGNASCKFSVVHNLRWFKDGDWHEKPSFFDVICFGDLAQNVDGSCSKGDAILIVGTLRQDSYEKDGVKKSYVNIYADHVGLDLTKRLIPLGVQNA